MNSTSTTTTISNANQNLATIADTCNQRISAIKKDVPATTWAITIDGVRVSAASTSSRSSRHASTGARRSRCYARRSRWLSPSRTRPMRSGAALDPGLRDWVGSTFGATSQVAMDFGYAPKKKGSTSTQTKLHATLQSKATRKARQTLGSKQKEAIKGVVTAVIPSGPDAPAAQAVAPAAQAVAPSGTPAAHSPVGASQRRPERRALGRRRPSGVARGSTPRRPTRDVKKRKDVRRDVLVDDSKWSARDAEA